jgi:hypothetical protein
MLTKEDLDYRFFTEAERRKRQSNHQSRLTRAFRVLFRADATRVKPLLDAIERIVQRSNPYTHHGKAIAQLDSDHEKIIGELLCKRKEKNVQQSLLAFLQEHGSDQELIASSIVNAWENFAPLQLQFAIRILSNMDSDHASVAVKMVASAISHPVDAVSLAATNFFLTHAEECGPVLPVIGACLDTSTNDEVRDALVHVVICHLISSGREPSQITEFLLDHLKQPVLESALRRLGDEGRAIRRELENRVSASVQPPVDWSRVMYRTTAGVIYEYGDPGAGNSDEREAARKVMERLCSNGTIRCEKVGHKFRFAKSDFPQRLRHLL